MITNNSAKLISFNLKLKLNLNLNKFVFAGNCAFFRNGKNLGKNLKKYYSLSFITKTTMQKAEYK